MSTTTVHPSTNSKSGQGSEEGQPDGHPLTLTPDLFRQHVRDMLVHYKSGATTVYQLPAALLHPVDAEGHMQIVDLHAAPALHPAAVGTHPVAQTPQQQLQQAASAGQESTNAFVQKQKDYASQQTNALQQNKNTNDFISKMNAQRAKAKQDSDANIDKMYDTFEKIGTQHPQLQSTILGTLSKIGAWMSSLLNSVVTFFANLVSKIVDWIKKAVVWVEGAAKTIADWASGAAKAVGNFFSNLF